MMSYLIVGLGAFFGANFRYLLSMFFGSSFHHPTLLVNILGSILAGVFMVLIVEYKILSDSARLFLIMGFCGSLTTMSTFTLDTLRLYESHRYFDASLNIVLNLCLSIGFMFVAVVVTRSVFKV